jgi:putative ABC transport system permease protein
MAIFAGIIVGLILVAFVALVPFFTVLLLSEFVLKRLSFAAAARFPLLMVRNLRRKKVRTALTFLGTFVLVLVVTTVWSVLFYIDQWTTEKTKDPKVIVTEKSRADSHMPFAYAGGLSEGGAVTTGDVRPTDSMTWQFYVGTLDPNKKTRDDSVFVIALEPAKILTMMNDVWDELIPKQAQGRARPPGEEQKALEAAIRTMEHNKRAVIVGRNRLKAIHKQVGDRFKLTGLNYKDIDLEFEIIATLPEGAKYNDQAFMNREYLNDAIEAYPRTHGGQKHTMADQTLDIVWLKVPDRDAFGRVARRIESSGRFRNPDVKCSTLAAAIQSVMESYRSLIWGMRWLLSPALLATMTLVLSNGINLSVRERRPEIAVLKVLGFRPGQILLLVLGEAGLIGATGGLLSAGLAYLSINLLLANVPDNIMYIPTSALWWGPVMGSVTALLGSIVPAWTACKVRVTEIFARVA